MIGKTICLMGIVTLLSSFLSKPDQRYSLEVRVNNLRNEKGVIQFVLYTRTDNFPETEPKNYYRKKDGLISDSSSVITFSNVPEGLYALNVFHDENIDGKINKVLMLPKEGIGFTNHDSIKFGNKPTFNSSSFQLNGDLVVDIKMHYF